MTDPPTTTLDLRARSVLRTILIVCVLCEIAFVVLDYHLNYRKHIDISAVRHLFNATREDAVGSWFAVTQTAFVALTTWLIFLTVRAQERALLIRIGWLVMAIFFSYMSFDDGAEFHERMGSTFKAVQRDATADAGEATAGQKVLGIFPSYAWQVVFLPIFGSMALFIVAFLWRQLGDRLGRLLLIAGFSCFVFAVGLDFIEGLDENHRWNLWTTIADAPGVEAFTRDRFNRSGFDAVRHFGKAFEESIEMLGMTLLWITFLRHWMRTTPRLLVRIS